MAIIISDKIDFKPKKQTNKKVRKDKEGHYILTENSIQQEDITIINICAPNNTPSKYIKQKLTELK